jgi:16S rRNA (guanine527-N7)-methyltransferase
MAQGVFSDRLPKAEAYVEILATDGVVRGLIGPREAPRLWDRHLLSCGVLAEGVAPDLDVCDVGTGAGLPGLVLAIARPDLSVTLVEPLLRRSTFLSEVTERLELVNVDVVRARAEELHGRREFTVVTSRAVAPLPRLLDWSMPLVRAGGYLLAIKGASAQAEVDDARGELERAHAGRVEIRTYGVGLLDPPTTAVWVEGAQGSRLGLDDQRRSGKSRSARSSRRKGRRA